MIAKLKKICIRVLNEIRFMVVRYRENKYVDSYIKNSEIYEGSEEEYINKVLPFWSKYNIRPNKKWFQYFGYISNSFDPYIIPSDLFYTKIIHYLNNEEIGEKLENKIYNQYFITNARIPQNYIVYSNGFFINENKKMVNKEIAIEHIVSKGESIFKPACCCQGHAIKILRSDEIDIGEFINNKIKENRDFIIQEIVKQSPQLSKFNKTSLNTIRVISLLIDGKVEILSAILRVGGEGSEVDNFHKGGESRPIDINGFLKDYALIGPNIRRVDRNGKQYMIEKVIGFDRVIEAVKANHPKLPHIRWIGWDFGINDNYEAVFIEFNAYAADNQRECGASFGDLTPKILDEYFSRVNI